jgi:hypothetical protein
MPISKTRRLQGMPEGREWGWLVVLSANTLQSQHACSQYYATYIPGTQCVLALLHLPPQTCSQPPPPPQLHRVFTLPRKTSTSSWHLSILTTLPHNHTHTHTHTHNHTHTHTHPTPHPHTPPQDVNIELFESHIRGGQPMAGLSGAGTRQVAALPPSVHAHAATAAVSDISAQPVAPLKRCHLQGLWGSGVSGYVQVEPAGKQLLWAGQFCGHSSFLNSQPNPFLSCLDPLPPPPPTQPMELSARPDVSALDRLATPPTGAGAIPTAALAGLNLQEGTPATTGTSFVKATPTAHHTVQLAA